MGDKKPIDLCFRGESVFITRGDITGLVKEEWFLSVIVGDDYWDEDLNKLEINEEKNTVMSIIETMRHNSLIVLKDVSLDYMLALAEKWCIPEMFIEYIKNEITIQKESNNNPLDNIVFMCYTCRIGFKMSKNKEDSCKSHPSSYSDGTFMCCGRTSDEPPCRIGYHVLCNDDKKIYYGNNEQL